MLTDSPPPDLWKVVRKRFPANSAVYISCVFPPPPLQSFWIHYCVYMSGWWSLHYLCWQCKCATSQCSIKENKTMAKLHCDFFKTTRDSCVPKAACVPTWVSTFCLLSAAFSLTNTGKHPLRGALCGFQLHAVLDCLVINVFTNAHLSPCYKEIY